MIRMQKPKGAGGVIDNFKMFVVRHPVLHVIAIKIKMALKTGTRKKVGSPVASSISYPEWITNYEPTLWEALEPGDKAPIISIVMPAYNTPDKYLNPLLQSVMAQTYQNWELCISDASTTDERRHAIEQAARQDGRIKYAYNKGLHISDNTNKALAMTTGLFVGFLDHDDVFSPHALEEVAVAYNHNPQAQIIYSDEDKLSDNGKNRSLPFFKPNWSPELLLGVNYITHFLVVRKSLLLEAGGLRSKFDGAQDYDLLLRLTEKTGAIVHIPKILYHWRQAEGSTSKNVGEKDYADTAGRRALNDASKRRGIKANILEIPDRPTNYRLRYQLPPKQLLASIIIPFKDRADLLRQCVNSVVQKTTYKNFEIILISNNSVEAETREYLSSIKDDRIRIFHWDNPFNYAALNNFGRAKAKGDFLILLNNDTEVITPEWIEELVGVACRPEIGAVGPVLFYPNYTIQHAGVILGMGGMAGHVFRNLTLTDWTCFGLPAWPRDYLAVTGACLVIETKKYDKVGGLDEKFIIAGNDVALGIKLYEAGYRNVFWPFAALIHHENQSVGSYQNAPKSDYSNSLTYYNPYLNWKDPYFNPNLDLMNEQVGIRKNYEK